MLGHKDLAQSPWWWVAEETKWYLKRSIQHLLVWEWEGLSPEHDKLDLMRSHSCCPYLCLYHALFGLPDLCFKAVTLFTVVTETAHLVSKHLSDCCEQTNLNHFQGTPSTGKPLWEIHSGKRGETTTIFYGKKRKDHYSSSSDSN